jgi:FHA domain/FhaA, N-terminal domain
MRPLSFLERSLERVFERSSARIFRAPIHRVVVERRLERAMEERRRRVGDRVIVPDAFVVEARAADLDALAAEAGGVDALSEALAGSALAFARAHGYTMQRLPTVTLVAEPDAPTGDVRVAAVEMAAGRSGAIDRRPAAVDQTRVFEVPRASAVLASLEVREPSGRARRVEVGGGPVVLGRDAACDIVLADARVSRRHARIAPRGGFLVLADLGSTNGTFLRGERIAEVTLGDGDVIVMGGTTVVVEGLDPGPPGGVA